ncbi:ribonucleotide-diphosphate reductase subunit beta [Vampirovibrio sp.]|uniref:ribonucleotide-diphosphate reductase subunit beta n=1 Tax=Vampirovibrio sp. TaxID=2717857 RepID=UPI00359421C1
MSNAMPSLAYQVNQRRIINGQDDVVQLYPIKHQFAWDSYLAGNANHWLPNEISMQKDIEQWRSSSILTDDERRVVKMALGFFTTADSIVANNLVLAVYKHITSPECRMYLLRQAYEEAIHTHAYQYIVESLGLDESEIFTMYNRIQAIYDKDQFASELVASIMKPEFATGTFDMDQCFLENLIDFYVIMEGIFFYSSFAAMLSFRRRNLLPGTAEQFQYIMRDESMHMNFGIEMIHQIIIEQPTLWTETFQRKISNKIVRAAELEEAYAHELMPNGILGMNASSFQDYTRYIADRRLNALHLATRFQAKNPFPWMSEAVDLTKSKNFFETRVTEYQTGGALEWDDF